VSAQELARIVAMSRWVSDTTATRVDPWRFGSVITTAAFPGRYDSNFLRIERSVGTTTPSELAAEAERWLGSFQHRELVVEDEHEGSRLAAGFRDLGYLVARHVVMVQREPDDSEPELPSAVEIDADALRPVVVATNLAIAGMRQADAEMLADFRAFSAARAGTRFFAVELDGVLASYCELYAHDGVAQVEDVNTLEAWRNRGAARAVVRAAVAAARADGADLVWLAADADDWPQHLYAKLGFEPIGSSWLFTKLPPEPGTALPGDAASAP
jgi:ribosomal protein S18 acetylase RimI-like enzyme